MQQIQQAFPRLSQQQIEQFQTMLNLYPKWNAVINVISRQDIDNLEIHHILHSLLIAKFIQLTPGTRVLDLGTGGGFPALPLAVMFPNVNFHLVDRIGKKLRVANDIATQTGLTNVTIQHGDVAEVKGTFHFVVSRAVMPLDETIPLIKRLIDKQQQNALPNGLICLKGGNLDAEIAATHRECLVEPLSQYSPLPYFETKKIVYTAL